MAAYRHKAEATVTERTVLIPSGESVIGADLTMPEGARGIVVVAHGSGSNRTSRRNRWVASELNWGRLATLLVDLLTIEEAALDQDTGEYRFDIQFLSHRLIDAIDWVSREPEIRHLPVGVFGASTGAAAALFAAARRPHRVKAVVSRGGRPDLAASVLSLVDAPTLLIVGENDPDVLAMNQRALSNLGGERRLDIVPGASHLFEEPGALDVVAAAARTWFSHHLDRELANMSPSVPW